MKTFRQIIVEVSQPKSEDELNFKEKHIVAMVDHPVADEDQFTADKIKKAKRVADYDDGEDMAVYEGVNLYDKPLPGQHKKAPETDDEHDLNHQRNQQRRHHITDSVQHKKDVFTKKNSDKEHNDYKSGNKKGEKLTEGLQDMSVNRLKFHLEKKFPHGSYTRKELADEHNRRARTEPNYHVTYKEAKPSVNEDLDGKQHKIDKNKNGKVDAHDFHLLRKKKNEEVEQIDELKKSTLSSYVKKASTHVGMIGMQVGRKEADADEVDRMTNRHMPDKTDVRKSMKKALGADAETIYKARTKAGNRLQGIDRASDRLAKESVELDEAMKLDKVNHVHVHGREAEEFAKHYVKGHKGDYASGGPTEKHEKDSNTFHTNYEKVDGKSRFAGSGYSVYKHKTTGEKFRVDRDPNGKTFYGMDHTVTKLHENVEQIDETAYDKDLEDHHPRIVSGVKGVKSSPFKKKFKNADHMNKWLDSDDASNHEIHHIMKEDASEEQKAKDLAKKKEMSKAVAARLAATLFGKVKNGKVHEDVNETMSLNDVDKVIRAQHTADLAKKKKADDLAKVDRLNKQMMATHSAVAKHVANFKAKNEEVQLEENFGAATKRAEASRQRALKKAASMVKNGFSHEAAAKNHDVRVDELKKHMNEEVEQIDEAFKAGSLKLKDGSSVSLKNEDVQALNTLFKQLNDANKSKMESIAMSGKKGFNEILGFAREAQ